MKLKMETLQAISLGAVELEETEQGIVFHRFTKEQRDLYRVRSADFYMKALSSSGVKLSFRTDSKVFGMKGETVFAASRRYFSFDLFINGEKKKSFDNFSNITEEPNNSKCYSYGPFEYKFELGEGEKEVVLYLPWSAKVILNEISVSDGAFIKPVKPEKKMLCFGDSITHGYDAAFSSNSYISRLARLLKVEEYNKAIGGEVFWPELAATSESFKPDMITVAYGTNDWTKSKSLEEFQTNCKSFYENLSRTYPDVPIFAISPIWREAYQEARPCGAFSNVHNFIVKLGENIPNMNVICGWEFIPHDSKYFRDERLHPNDHGFAFYAESLYREIQKYS